MALTHTQRLVLRDLCDDPARRRGEPFDPLLLWGREDGSRHRRDVVRALAHTGLVEHLGPGPGGRYRVTAAGVEASGVNGTEIAPGVYEFE